MHLNLLMFLGGLFLQKETKSVFDCISLEDKFMMTIILLCVSHVFKKYI